jgi:tetratricopeptide (TPR) repeat protein
MSNHSIENRFDAQQVIAMAQRLKVREIEALGEATELREAGLRAARADDLTLGHRLIHEARVNREFVALSDEAATMFETYQRAAESYIDYREGRYDAAIAAMQMAIADANRLRVHYGYIVELRRIHLAANIIRIAVRAGNHEEAMQAGFQLVRYILGNRNAWPWATLVLEDTDLLSNECRSFVLAQVLFPLSDALAALCTRPVSYLPNDETLECITHGHRDDTVGEAVAQWVEVAREQITIARTRRDA